MQLDHVSWTARKNILYVKAKIEGGATSHDTDGIPTGHWVSPTVRVESAKDSPIGGSLRESASQMTHVSSNAALRGRVLGSVVQMKRLDRFEWSNPSLVIGHDEYDKAKDVFVYGLDSRFASWIGELSVVCTRAWNLNIR